jgi:hypothetical protein
MCTTLRQTERDRGGLNKLARPVRGLGEGSDYLSPPLRLEPGRIRDERKVGHVAPRFATHDCARTGIAATCFDPGLDRDGLPSLEGLLPTLTKVQPLTPALIRIEAHCDQKNRCISMTPTEVHFEK